METFWKGMDISGLPELEDEGRKIRDFDGSVIDGFDLAAKYGVNSIRLRIWNQPENIKEARGYCNLSHTIAMAKRIKAHGMHFMLDFHYSDYWADPGQQNKPKAWENLSFEALKTAVYEYTKNTLLSLQSEGVLPDVVQIGNEIRSGLLFPDGELPDYGQMVQLVNAGIQGARAVAGKDQMQVMIHLDQGGRYFYLKEWFDRSIEAGLEEFDLIGLSYYPFWHGTFTDLRETLIKLIADYNKPIMLVETAHAWRKSEHGFIDESQEKIAGVPATKEGQRKVLDLVMNIAASIPGNMCCGVYYWEPLCIPKPGEGGWCENMGILDAEGKVMEAVHAFAFTTDKLRSTEPAKVYEPEMITIVKGEKPKLPEELPVLFYDGSMQRKKAAWQTNEIDWELGKYKVNGKIEGVEEPVICRVCVVEQMPELTNLLRDTNWEKGLTQWEIKKSEEQVMAQLCPEFEIPFPAPPIHALRVEAPKNFTFSITQQIAISKDGFYDLQVEFKGTDTTNVDIRLFVEKEDGIQETVIHPTEHAWETYQTGHVWCKAGDVTVGIRISSPPIYGMMRRFSFFQSQDDVG